MRLRRTILFFPNIPVLSVLKMTFITGAAYFTLIQLHTFTLGNWQAYYCMALVFPVMSLTQNGSQSYLFKTQLKNSNQPLSMYCNELNTDNSHEK